MTLALSGKGSTINACGERRTPSLCSGSAQWAAVRARGFRAPTGSPSPNTARRQVGRHAHGQGLRLRSKLLASFGRGAPRCPRVLQRAARAGRVAVLAGAASAVPMRYNNALLTDAFHSALRAARGAAKRGR
jgi:hypothetical protein